MATLWSLALRAIPWATMLANAPAIVRAADSFLAAARARSPRSPSSEELKLLADRIAALETHDQAAAELLKQIAEQMATLTTASEVLAGRLRWLLAIGIVSAVLATLALAIVIGR